MAVTDYSLKKQNISSQTYLKKEKKSERTVKHVFPIRTDLYDLTVGRNFTKS